MKRKMNITGKRFYEIRKNCRIAVLILCVLSSAWSCISDEDSKILPSSGFKSFQNELAAKADIDKVNKFIETLNITFNQVMNNQANSGDYSDEWLLNSNDKSQGFYYKSISFDSVAKCFLINAKRLELEIFEPNINQNNKRKSLSVIYIKIKDELDNLAILSISKEDLLNRIKRLINNIKTEINLSNKERVQLLTQARTLEAIIDWIEKIIKTNTSNIYTSFANSESMSWQCAVSIIGNAAATIGLAACAETAGIGCAAAAVGKIASLVLTVDTCTVNTYKKSSKERKNRINQLIRKISHD